MVNVVAQVQVPVGRGKPPTLIERDESLDKVFFLIWQNIFNKIKLVVDQRQKDWQALWFIVLASSKCNVPRIMSFASSYL
jgi:hypothetical protein